MPQEFINAEEFAWKYNLDTFAIQASHGAWKPYPHLMYAINRIQPGIQRGNYRGIISMPPRHGKSETFSKWLPMWFQEWRPSNKVFLATYGESLASDFGMRVRDELRSSEKFWSKVRRDKDKASDCRTPEGGGMVTSGVSGKATGFGGHLLICDDPIKNWKDALSVSYRRGVIDWFRSTFLTRIEPGASILVIMTRWMEDDLAGWLLREQSGVWDNIVLRAFAEEDDPLGRALGEPLCPERYTKEDLEKFRHGLGEQMFAGLYQQRPSPAEGAMVNREWIKHYAVAPPTIRTIVASWDMSFKESGNSYTVGQIWGADGANRYLLDQVRLRADFPRILAEVEALQSKWKQCSKILIEDAANGPAVISALRNKIPGIIPVRALSSKASRLSAILPMFESGNVYFPPAELPWVQELIEELVGFPHAAHDDQCDALSQALNNLTYANLDYQMDIGTALARQSPWGEYYSDELN